MKIQQPKKRETRTKVDFLYKRAIILSKKPARKSASKMKKKTTFRQTITKVSKNYPLFGTKMGLLIPISLIHPWVGNASGRTDLFFREKCISSIDAESWERRKQLW